MQAIKSYLLKKPSPIIAHFQIDGNIDSKTHLKLGKHIQKMQSQKKQPKVQAIFCSVHSRGGSPVHAEIMGEKLKQLAKFYGNVPLFTFAEGICASGGYHILCVGDKVYADPYSFTGSIGVVTARIGLKAFVDTYNKGAQRTVLKTSEHLIQNQADMYADNLED